MKRLFIAVDISEQARNLAARYIAGLKSQFPDLRVGWERPEKLHLTIKFLGTTSDEKLLEVTERLVAIAGRFDPFSLTIAEVGSFPSPRNARILWLGITDGSGTLAKMAAAVIREMEGIGFEREKRRFKAHLTIARLKEPQLSKELVEKHRQMRYEPLEFHVGEIVLYESQLRPTGSVYSKLALFPFSGSN